MVPVQQEVKITRPLSQAHSEILSEEAVRFLARLGRRFEDGRQELLRKRRTRQGRHRQDAGFSTRDRVCPGRAVGGWAYSARLTRPARGDHEPKMIINALSSGASVFTADFEDANSPTWQNMLEGQVNLRDALTEPSVISVRKERSTKLGEKAATLMVRPRGWHLDEKHFLVGGKPISGSLFDFGLLFFHNAKTLIAKGTGPYFYLPKLESHLEARLGNEVFNLAQDGMGGFGGEPSGPPC